MKTPSVLPLFGSKSSSWVNFKRTAKTPLTTAAQWGRVPAVPPTAWRGRGGLVAAPLTALYSLAALASSEQPAHTSTVYWALSTTQPPLVPPLFCTGPRHVSSLFFFFSNYVNTRFALSSLPLCYFEPPKGQAVILLCTLSFPLGKKTTQKPF